MRKNGASVFWFILPGRSTKNNEENSCDHKAKSCQTHLLEGLKKYAMYGLILEVVKNLFSRIPLIRKEPSRILYHLFANPNFKFLKFFIVYIGMFRGVSCLVNNYWKSAREYSTLLGGMAGGVSYMFFPSYNLFTSSVVTFLQVSMKLCWCGRNRGGDEEINKIYYTNYSSTGLSYWSDATHPSGCRISIGYPLACSSTPYSSRPPARPSYSIPRWRPSSPTKRSRRTGETERGHCINYVLANSWIYSQLRCRGWVKVEFVERPVQTICRVHQLE